MLFERASRAAVVRPEVRHPARVYAGIFVELILKGVLARHRHRERAVVVVGIREENRGHITAEDEVSEFGWRDRRRERAHARDAREREKEIEICNRDRKSTRLNS